MGLLMLMKLELYYLFKELISDTIHIQIDHFAKSKQQKNTNHIGISK
jgi:hypothetical protein